MSGEQGQFEQHFLDTYKDNKDGVYRICCYYLSDPDDRKDLFQDIWTTVLKNLDSFKGRSTIRTWIYRIATNQALIYLKHSKKIPVNRNHPHSEFILQNLATESNDSKLELEKDLEVMLGLINNLPVQDKVLISLVLEDMSGKEISDVTGFSESNVRVRIHRIKKKLTEAFKKLQSHV